MLLSPLLAAAVLAIAPGCDLERPSGGPDARWTAYRVGLPGGMVGRVGDPGR